MLFLVNWRHPALRLDGAEGDVMVALVAWLLPLIGTIRVVPRLNGLRLALFGTLMLPVILICVVPELFEVVDAVDIARRGRDPLFEPLQAITIPTGGAVVAYRTNCGLLCSNGIEIRQENMLVGPLKLVRIVYANYPADSADVHLVDEHTVAVDSTHVRLLPHVVF